MRINGIGCCLVDNLYVPVDFGSVGYRKWMAESGVENGLITGGLIFGEDLEASSGVGYGEILEEICGGVVPGRNMGGPAIVALIHMVQVLDGMGHRFGFIGCRGDDEGGAFLSGRLGEFDIDCSSSVVSRMRTPFTDVFADPEFNYGEGERTFVNYIGAAGDFGVENVPSSFFDADMLIFGGTALTPGIHDGLSGLLYRGRLGKCLNCVNTVYDFRSQKRDGFGRWPLVDDDDYSLIDLLICDYEEAFRISGQREKRAAAEFFIDSGVGSVVITHGADEILCGSGGTVFREKGFFSLPVSREAGKAKKILRSGMADTTGCGDNFAGGVYASVVRQLGEGQGGSLKCAAVHGIVAGGFAGLYSGGVYQESFRGEKRERMGELLSAYAQQTGIDGAGC